MACAHALLVQAGQGEHVRGTLGARTIAIVLPVRASIGELKARACARLLQRGAYEPSQLMLCVRGGAELDEGDALGDALVANEELQLLPRAGYQAHSNFCKHSDPQACKQTMVGIDAAQMELRDWCPRRGLGPGTEWCNQCNA